MTSLYILFVLLRLFPLLYVPFQSRRVNKSESHQVCCMQHSPSVRIDVQLCKLGVHLGKDHELAPVDVGLRVVIGKGARANRLPRLVAPSHDDRKPSESNEIIVRLEVSEDSELEKRELRDPGVIVVVNLQVNAGYFVDESVPNDPLPNVVSVGLAPDSPG